MQHLKCRLPQPNSLWTAPERPLSPPRPPKQTTRNREGFRALLGVRKYPKNESLVLWAVAMGISAEGLDWWGLLKPGLAG
ncbi:MAG: hypothetical protein O9270_11595, partial [Aquidulcibacter sp.]|uniref:hypothetical protein n=1 Tax=Aquidulcibacter sp. TaxID=2052990 RepID=UPI0022C5FBE7